MYWMTGPQATGPLYRSIEFRWICVYVPAILRHAYLLFCELTNGCNELLEKNHPAIQYDHSTTSHMKKSIISSPPKKPPLKMIFLLFQGVGYDLVSKKKYIPIKGKPGTPSISSSPSLHWHIWDLEFFFVSLRHAWHRWKSKVCAAPWWNSCRTPVAIFAF